MKSNFTQLGDIVLEYFKDYDDNILCDIVKFFVFQNKLDIDNPALEIFNKFIDANGLTQAREHEIEDRHSEFFNKSSYSEKMMIEQLKNVFLNIAFMRFFDLTKTGIKMQKAQNDVNKAHFKLLKHQALNMYESLNRNASYFYSKEEDSANVQEIKNMKFYE